MITSVVETAVRPVKISEGKVILGSNLDNAVYAWAKAMPASRPERSPANGASLTAISESRDSESAQASEIYCTNAFQYPLHF